MIAGHDRVEERAGAEAGLALPLESGCPSAFAKATARQARVLPGIREAYKDPLYMGNLERVGLDFAAYWQAQNPDAYEAFVKRIG